MKNIRNIFSKLLFASVLSMFIFTSGFNCKNDEGDNCFNSELAIACLYPFLNSAGSPGSVTVSVDGPIPGITGATTAYIMCYNSSSSLVATNSSGGTAGQVDVNADGSMSNFELLEVTNSETVPPTTGSTASLAAGSYTCYFYVDLNADSSFNASDKGSIQTVTVNGNTNLTLSTSSLQTLVKDDGSFSNGTWAGNGGGGDTACIWTHPGASPDKIGTRRGYVYGLSATSTAGTGTAAITLAAYPSPSWLIPGTYDVYCAAEDGGSLATINTTPFTGGMPHNFTSIAAPGAHTACKTGVTVTGAGVSMDSGWSANQSGTLSCP